MENKRVREFFELTEKNILGAQTSGDPTIKKNKRNSFSRPIIKKGSSRFFLRMGMVVLLVFSVLSHKWQHLIVQPSLTMVKQLPKNAKYVRERSVSLIPNYQMAAQRQFLRVFPLHKIDVVQLDEGDFMPNEALMLVDSVIVVPKIYSHA